MTSQERKEFYEVALKEANVKVEAARVKITDTDAQISEMMIIVNALQASRRRLEDEERSALAYAAAAEMLLRSDV
jgi:hypothetical protein